MTLVVLGVAWLFGLFVVGALHAPWWLAGVAAALILPLVLAFAPRSWVWIGCLAAFLALVAGWRASSVSHEAPAWAGFVGQEVILQGRVESEPDPGFSTVSYEVSVGKVSAPLSQQGGGRIIVFVPQFEPRLRLHSIIEIRGDLDLPPSYDNFDYRGYLRNRDVFGSMFSPAVIIHAQPSRMDLRYELSRLRLHLEDGLRRALPEPQASLAAGIAFGRDEGLSSDTKADFVGSGLAHLTAVSGSNVSLIVALFLVLLAPNIGRKWAIWLAIAGVVFYVALAGASPSVVRAGVMASIYLVGWFVGRPQSGLAGLAAAAMLMTVWTPQVASDPGFQLSLAATAGLITLGPWFIWAAQRLGRLPAVRFVYHDRLAVVFALSLAASVSTAPLITYHFGRVSFVGVVANLVAAPLFVIAFVGGWIVAIAGLCWPPAGFVAGLAVYYPLALLTWMAEVTANWPLSTAIGKGQLMPALAGMLLLLTLGGVAYLRIPLSDEQVERPKRVPKSILIGGLGGAALMAVAILGFAPSRDSGELRVDFLDVGQGDAILVTTPGGTQMLVDGGPAGMELIRELGATMPHWDRTLDSVVLTHGDQDHVAGLALLSERYDVENWFDNGQPRTTPAFAAYLKDSSERRTLVAGDRWTTDGVTISVLWPPAGFAAATPNEASIVLRITYGDVSFLLTGDLQGAPLATLSAQPGVYTMVLKVPHHGSKTTTASFFAATAASVAIISVGCENQYGHPTKQTLDSLQGVTVLRTDIDGRVTVRTDGKRMSVRTERRDTAAERTPGTSACRR